MQTFVPTVWDGWKRQFGKTRIKMRSLILSNYSDKIAELNALTAPNKLNYAERHGYEFENLNLPYTRENHVKWLEEIELRLEEYECVMTIGCDAIYTNLSRRIGDVVRSSPSLFDVYLTK